MGIDRNNLQKLSQMADAREIADYVKAFEDRKRKKKQAESMALPLLALGIGGAGLGMKTFGEKILSPEDRRSVDALIALRYKTGGEVQGGEAPFERTNAGSYSSWLLPDVRVNPNYKGSPQLFYDYIDAATLASNVKLFGSVKPDDIVSKLKDVLKLPNPKITDANLTDLEREDLRHYPAFHEGPVSAWGHQHLKPVLYTEAHPGKEGHQNPGYFAGSQYEGKVSPREFYTNLQNAFSGYLADKGLTMDSAKKLPHADQMQLITGLQGYMEAKPEYKELADQKKTAESALAKEQAWSINTYGKGADVATKVFQDLPRYAGYAAMAAGAGLGGYWLYRYLKNRYGKKDVVQRPQALKNLAEYGE